MKLKKLFSSLCLLVFLAGCSAPKAIETKSGFLTDYSKLQISKTDKNAAVYIADGFDPKNYKKITFAPVQVRISPQLEQDSNLDSTQQKEIAEYIVKQLNKSLAKSFTGGGQGTLNVRTSVSGLSSNSENLSFYQLLPVTFAATAALEVAGQRDKHLVVFFELEAVDETTGDIVAAEINASDLGFADTGDLKDDPVAAIEPLLEQWIDDIILNIDKKLQ